MGGTKPHAAARLVLFPFARFAQLARKPRRGRPARAGDLATGACRGRLNLAFSQQRRRVTRPRPKSVGQHGCYTGSTRLWCARPMAAVAGSCPAITRTPSSSLLVMLAGEHTSRKATPFFLQALNTRRRASCISVG